LFTWRFIMTPYTSSVEKEMKKFFDSLSEKDKRRYAAIETLKHYKIVLLGTIPQRYKTGNENEVKL
jgi:hypothetical protein